MVALFTNRQDMKGNSMSVNRGMDTEDVTHMHNGILLSHKKEQNNAMPFIVHIILKPVISSSNI